MQRYFVPPEQFGPESVRITGDDAHHLLRVMRGQPGDKVICSNGSDRVVLAELQELGKTEAQALIVEELPFAGEPAIEVWVAQSLPKGDKLETVIQKGTEIGAAKFLPFLSERTVVQYDAKKEAKKLERWQKIAKEAAEQAHRSRVPVVDGTRTWKELLKAAAEADLALICYEKENGLQLKQALAGKLGQPAEGKKALRVLFAIGPEGGFAEQEVEQAEEAGFRSVGLGARILRTETAAMVALACLFYESGEMGE
ncbi:16S rRNA (uracil(1498)-N(3))-methyltransferase [Paenibacillus aurantius]|uniref:Ribosomal RNA small subunit methyltransferase E n=1 Tax=Paenibacillus aurantius TaxID=2918900 RepID=A0AA96LJ08_9BACL|nr:16S rRNA (uracil(1498)-N(3))-methyltransferase [Paenibacillus aurantius]WNQ14213.1 16S rRNA (uracil(1498)-N(3))-methyltransferase [Paenibacillus aurantius]